MTILKFLYCALLLLLFLPLSSVAQGSDPKGQVQKVKLDGVEYTREQIISDFISVAFPSEQASSGVEAAMLPTKREGYWWERFLFTGHVKNSPEPRISRWKDSRIVVDIGWPKDDLGNIVSPGLVKAVRKASPDLSADELLLYSAIKEAAEIINKKTSVHVDVVSGRDAKYWGENYARVRIIPLYANDIQNFFKKSLRSHSVTPLHDHQYYDGKFANLTYFTPNVRSQVSGYYVSSANGEIDLSVCHISPYVQDVLVRSLVQECLTRAFGLAGEMASSRRSILSNWNAIYDPVSKTEILDGDSATFAENEKKNFSRILSKKDGSGVDANTKEVPENLRKKDFVDKVSWNKDPQIFSEYDSLMVKILYCPSVHLGMSKDDVFRLLSDPSNDCF